MTPYFRPRRSMLYVPGCSTRYLHKARTLMIQDGLNAGIAALQVGYESPSQFNREYKRLFGVTPAKDATILRGQHRVSP